MKKKISFACLVCGVTVPYNKFPVLRGRHQVSEGQSSVKAAEAMKIKHAQCQSWSLNCSIFDINCSADADPVIRITLGDCIFIYVKP